MSETSCEAGGQTAIAKAAELASSDDTAKLQAAVLCLTDALRALENKVEGLRDGTVAFTAKPLVPDGINFRKVEAEAK